MVLERAALAVKGAVALGGTDPDCHRRQPNCFAKEKIASPIIASPVTVTSTPARRRVAEIDQACGFAGGRPLPFEPARS